MRQRRGLWLGLLLAAACGGDPVDRDVTALRTADPAGRKQAAQDLADRRDSRASAALVFALKDPDAGVRCAAAKALGQQDADTAVPALVAVVTGRAPGHECIFEPLGKLRDARAIAPLLATQDPRGLATVVTFGPAAIGPLIGALRNERDPQRAEILAKALVDAGGKDVLQPLLAMIVEYDRTANANAALALGVLGDPQALPALVRAADALVGPAPRALARIGKPGIDDLLKRLEHPKEIQRRTAADALALASDPRVVPALEAELASTNAVIAAGSARALMQLANSPSPLQASAAEALDRAWQRSDTRTIGAGVDYFLRRHPDGEDQLIDALEMHGDEALATAFLQSSSPTLRAAGVEWGRQSGLTPCVTAPGSFRC